MFAHQTLLVFSYKAQEISQGTKESDQFDSIVSETDSNEAEQMLMPELGHLGSLVQHGTLLLSLQFAHSANLDGYWNLLLVGGSSRIVVALESFFGLVKQKDLQHRRFQKPRFLA